MYVGFLFFRLEAFNLLGATETKEVLGGVVTGKLKGLFQLFCSVRVILSVANRGPIDCDLKVLCVCM